MSNAAQRQPASDNGQAGAGAVVSGRDFLVFEDLQDHECREFSFYREF